MIPGSRIEFAWHPNLRRLLLRLVAPPSPPPIRHTAGAEVAIAAIATDASVTAYRRVAVKNSNSAAQQQAQSLPGGGVFGATGLPQHMAMHPYSQHSVPLGLLNMMGYPLWPQSYTCMPSAFQQAFAVGNSTHPQSLASTIPLLQQSAVAASGYSGFGNSNNIQSNFPLNPPSASAGTSMNYEDVLSSQYKDASHLLYLQQGHGSRTMSGVPGDTYYSFQGAKPAACWIPTKPASITALRTVIWLPKLLPLSGRTLSQAQAADVEG